MLPNLNKITLISQDSLSLDDVLGRGAFGTVYKGYWQSEGEEFKHTVAVKVLNENTAAESTSELLDVSGIVNVLRCACVWVCSGCVCLHVGYGNIVYIS